MSLPSNLMILIEQIESELTLLDSDLDQIIKLLRERMELFSDNIVLIQIFATLNNYRLFVQNTRIKLENTIQYFTKNKAPSQEDIREIGEDLSEQLGRVLEAKIIVSNIRNRLED